ncbi:MAG: NTP transferase domain-containing protein [Chloroherpetonaceae bacterium]|nr:NTP transferase domain-containing protein [Chloroherpetonaceae bacterium]MCS7210970.1 NTP transferase domain-containing protein [Chloroherpetonaceae bacterium]MDW8019121.1 NTP transferase domain-containing protein [Chloroherpetonaceae bacterium]MDW8466935.1 NTP transferase domain-containing protein [Chloroherpetonaceae bacterium]
MTALYGLVLAGGKSTRMGRDKGSLSYHGVSQRVFAAHLLSEFCRDVFISCRAEQVPLLEPELKPLVDTFCDVGPAGGILTALHFRPESAWLVVACDLPFLSSKALQMLVDARDPNKVATAYQNPDDRLPEPLIAIYEPKSREGLLAAVQQGKTCPRKFLLSADCKFILPEKREIVANINTPEEYEQAIAAIVRQA